MTGDNRHRIAKILNEASITKVIKHYLDVQANKALCPFHEESKPSFSISEEKGLFYCFGCQQGGNAIKFVQLYLNSSFIMSAKTVANICDISVNLDPIFTEKYASFTNYYDMFAKKCHDNLTIASKSYLYSRGLDDDTINKYQIGFCESALKLDMDRSILHKIGIINLGKTENSYYDCFFNRLIFPIRDPKGYCRGFGSRAINDAVHPKYVNSNTSALFSKSAALYGLYEALQTHDHLDRTQQSRKVYMVEGYLDTLSLSCNGIKDVVSCMGTQINTVHIQSLFRYYNEICFILDGDKAGYEAMIRAASLVSPFTNNKFKASFVLLTDKQDPNSYLQDHGKVAFNKLCANSLSLEEFLLHVAKTTDSSQIIQTIADIIIPMSHCPQKISLMRSLSRYLKISYYDLKMLCSQPTNSTVKTTYSKPVNCYDRLTRRAASIMIQHPKESYKVINSLEVNVKTPLLISISTILKKYAGNLNTSSICSLLEEETEYTNIKEFCYKQLELSETALMIELNSIYNLLAKNE